MENLEIWKELEIDKTKDEKAIKAAYYAKLKRVNPEDDPEGFKRLRTAFDEAIGFARSNEEEKEKDEYDLWIDEIKEVYDNISRRTNPAEWERIFEQEICRSLDTQDMAAERLLVFMMENYYMPYHVFDKLEEIFGIVERKEALVEKFPDNFIDYIIGEIENRKDDGFYDHFDGDQEQNPDRLILTQSQCLDDIYEQLLLKDLDQRDFSLIHEKLKEIHEMDIRHAYTPIIEEIVAFYEKDTETVKNSFNRLVEKLGDDPEPYLKNHHLLEGYALGYEVTGQKEKADKLRDYLSKETDRLYILSDCVRYYLDAGDAKRAKDLAVDCMGKSADFPALHQYMSKANEDLINSYLKEAEEGNEDSAYEVGWIYFQNEQFKECIEYIMPRKPEAGSEKEYTYYNLLGRCLARNEQYDEAIPYLMRARELILKVKEKGAEGEEEERMLKREGLILATIAMSYHEKSKAILENEKASRENYRKADEFQCEAIKIIEESVAVETEIRDKIFYQRERALIYFANEQYSRCIDVCDEILKTVPNWYYIYLLRGQAFYKLDYPQNVIDDYHSITEVIPDGLDNPDIYIAPLMTYLNYNRYENANEMFEFAKEHGAKSAAIDLLKLYCEYEQDPDSHDLAEITACIERLVNEENDLSKEDIADLIFFAAYAAEDEDYFIKTMEKAIDLYPGCTRKMHWYIGIYYERKGEYQTAIKYLENVAQLAFREDYRNHNMLRVGKNYWYMDQDDKALEIYMSVYEKDPKQSDVNRCLAEFYLYKFRSDHKDETLDLALKYINDQFEIYVDQDIKRIRAEINLDKYEIEESKKDLLDILENDPDSISAMRMLQRVYRYEGDFEKAYQICLKLMEYEDDNRYLAKYEKYLYCAMALRRYEGLEKIILDAYKYDREWAIDNLRALYFREGRMDDLMEAARESIKNGESSYEKFLGYRTVLDVLCEKGAKEDDDALKTAVKEYLEYIRKNPDELMYGYDCLDDFYFENYGDTKEAIRYLKEMQKEKMDDYYLIRSNLSLATYYALSGDSTKAKKYFNAFTKHMKKSSGSLENWLKEDGYSRTRCYNLGMYYYGMQDIEELEKCLTEMAKKVVCKTCNKCKCFEYYILKGHLEKLKGNREEALKAYEIALDSGENANRDYITRLIKEC